MATATGSGLTRWSVYHPVGVSMLALTILVLGWFGFDRLAIDLLPQIIYPEISIRVSTEASTPVEIEDKITRQLEEQLAITEGVISMSSDTSNSRSAIDLTFPYEYDIDIALRDASTRLDRAKRFLPDEAEQPIIFKRDPSQIAVAELIISSPTRPTAELRHWVEYQLSRHFLTIPGVASTEIGGGGERRITILPDPLKLLHYQLTLDELTEAITSANRQQSTGVIRFSNFEIESYINNRFTSLEQLRQLPIPLGNQQSVALAELAQIWPGGSEERIKVRLNGESGIKLSIQKLPLANSVAVVDGVRAKLTDLRQQGLFADDIRIDFIQEQGSFVAAAIHSTQMAGMSAILLAMSIIYLFLGDWRRTLIIGTAIPFAMMITFILMASSGLSLNIMTLGGLALGVGLLLDNTIVMLENIHRHQQDPKGNKQQKAALAAAEIQSAIVASTSTNLAALLPFLLIGGLIGLLFRELILTITAALLASLLLSLTLVPALSSQMHSRSSAHRLQQLFNAFMALLQNGYSALLRALLRLKTLQLLFIAALLAGMWLAVPRLMGGIEQFLPAIDNGDVVISISSDPGTSLADMDAMVSQIEAKLAQDHHVATQGVVVGGFIFGRTTIERSNRSFFNVTLLPRAERPLTVEQWVDQFNQALKGLDLTGFRIRVFARGIRGIRLGGGDEDLTLRIQGDNLDTLATLALKLSSELANNIEGLSNIGHSVEDRLQQIEIQPDLAALQRFGIAVDELNQTIRDALQGRRAGDLLSGQYPIEMELRLTPPQQVDLELLQNLVVGQIEQTPLYLHQVAQLGLTTMAAEILHDNQQRVVEVTAAIRGDVNQDRLYQQLDELMTTLELPEGYTIYESGAREEIEQSQQRGQVLVLLAIFLVFVVMAVQYESLRNPIIILLAIPFALLGVAGGLELFAMPLSMPVILGTIMLTGIVVNNAILLVEYFEIGHRQGLSKQEAILEAARLRLRPILMTTLTTVLGMLPLALNQGSGAEMLQPLATTLISGLTTSLPVTLMLIPLIYHYLGREHLTATSDLAPGRGDARLS
ncbi:efflux RND transporter permease subunit [Ectothiorhodospiraceae bacterium BW-2]|nr:efflux RND transporter permease subunit [Ectothiorhodospiraceae bacterium BW-2]